MLNIKKELTGDTLTFVLEGQIDTNTSPQLAEAINDNTDKVAHLILDLSAVDYVSSAGLRVFLTAESLMSDKGDFTLRHVNENVMEVLEMTGFSDILNIENN